MNSHSNISKADKLGAHRRSAAGVRCIKPLLEEEAEIKKLHEEQKASRDEVPGTDGLLLPELPLPELPLLESPLPELPQPGLPASTAFNLNDGFRPTYTRPKHDRVFCKQCNDFPEGFRGEHELRRHQDRQHKTVIKKWVCIEPSDGLSHPKPVLPLSRCKACAKQKKTYGAYYNAAAHLRRSHFKTKAKGRNRKEERRSGVGGRDWPPMSELKYWMKEVEEIVPPRVSQ
jgi:hypothetical protein